MLESLHNLQGRTRTWTVYLSFRLLILPPIFFLPRKRVTTIFHSSDRVRRKLSFLEKTMLLMIVKKRCCSMHLKLILVSGYGTLTPKTDLGKLTTIFYALAGIPLLFLYVRTFGQIMGTAFKYSYAKMCRWEFKERCPVKHWTNYALVQECIARQGIMGISSKSRW